jgi:hypothetical protein
MTVCGLNIKKQNWEGANNVTVSFLITLFDNCISLVVFQICFFGFDW